MFSGPLIVMVTEQHDIDKQTLTEFFRGRLHRHLTACEWMAFEEESETGLQGWREAGLYVRQPLGGCKFVLWHTRVYQLAYSHGSMVPAPWQIR
jgi:hypothetical protein